METDDFADLARTLKRPAFVAKLPNLFLVIEVPQSEDRGAFAFETRVIKPAGPQRSAVRRASDHLEVLELVKAEGNPYPDRISIGRARNCDVVLRDPSVSKLHAHVRRGDGGRLDLVDLASQNGTRIEGRDLVQHQPTELRAGQTLQFGAVSARLIDAGGLYDLLQ